MPWLAARFRGGSEHQAVRLRQREHGANAFLGEPTEGPSEPLAQVSMDRHSDDVPDVKRFRRALRSRRPLIGRLSILEDYDDRSTTVDTEACRGRDLDCLGRAEVHSRLRLRCLSRRFTSGYERYLLWLEMPGSQDTLHDLDRVSPRPWPLHEVTRRVTAAIRTTRVIRGILRLHSLVSIPRVAIRGRLARHLELVSSVTPGNVVLACASVRECHPSPAIRLRRATRYRRTRTQSRCPVLPVRSGGLGLRRRCRGRRGRRPSRF